MAAELSYNEMGFAEIFTVRLPAWHREGHVYDEPPTYEQAMSHGLDYEVIKRPTYTRLVAADGEEMFVENATAFVTYRADRDIELGAVGPSYTPLQNALAFRVLEPLVDSGVLLLETGGVLRDGADAWLMGRFDMEKFGPVVREVFTDEVLPYIIVTNNHTGRRNATIAETPIRVVCANTLGMAEHDMDKGGRSVAVRHTGEAEVRMVEAAEKLLGGIIERYEVIATQYKLLKQTILDREAFERLVLDPAVPDPRDAKNFNPDAKLAEMVVARADRKRSELTRLWHEGDGNVGDNSAWEAYNGLTQAVDHDNDLFPTRGGTYRTAGLLHGRLRDIKDTVLNKLVKHASGLEMIA